MALAPGAHGCLCLTHGTTACVRSLAILWRTGPWRRRLGRRARRVPRPSIRRVRRTHETDVASPVTRFAAAAASHDTWSPMLGTDECQRAQPETLAPVPRRLAWQVETARKACCTPRAGSSSATIDIATRHVQLFVGHTRHHLCHTLRQPMPHIVGLDVHGLIVRARMALGMTQSSSARCSARRCARPVARMRRRILRTPWRMLRTRRRPWAPISRLISPRGDRPWQSMPATLHAGTLPTAILYGSALRTGHHPAVWCRVD